MNNIVEDFNFVINITNDEINKEDDENKKYKKEDKCARLIAGIEKERLLKKKKQEQDIIAFEMGRNRRSRNARRRRGKMYR